MICLQNVSRIYSRKQSTEDVVALDNISLTLPETGFISIVGASGSGKTTLLNIIGGLDKPTSGNMIVDGLCTSSFKNKEWDSYRNEKIGFVLQNCYLLPHLTIRDNVALKLQISNKKYEDIYKMVDDSLNEVGLLDRKNDRPNTLSGGQKQRVAIARAIVGKPTVILADEPTGAIDSKNGIQIMEILKKLSADHLIVMVTHNKEFADKYSDRIIELKDGKITADSAPIENKPIDNAKPLSKVSIPVKTSLKWGFKNLIIKKYSTLSVVLASALGLCGVGLIISLSNGVSQAFVKAEEDALYKYPVTITSYSKQSSEGSEEKYEEFPAEQSVIVDLSNYAKQEHFNYMSDEFLTYMGEMPTSYYNLAYNGSVTNLNLYTKVNDTKYKKISSTSSLFYKSIDDFNYLANEYDCLKGNFPTSKNEVALVVDKYNRVSGSTLDSLGFDVDLSHYSQSKITFDNIIGKTYRYVPNNDYYYYDALSGIYKVTDKTAEQFYNDSTVELRISGILREKELSNNPLLRDGIIYNPEFQKEAIFEANNSEIVIKQKEYGLTKNVLTGLPFVDTQSGDMLYSAAYIYEGVLFAFTSFERVTTLYYFTKDFNSRGAISNYFEQYVADETIDYGSLKYNDYLERVSGQFNGAIGLMTSVLYVFAVVSVVVSAILNGILTYLSIHQRTSEIGLLRSLGARKLDIGIMVETESLMSGLIGSLVSVAFCFVLVPPVNVMLTDAIYKYKFYLLSNTTFTLPGFQPWVIPIVIGVGLLTALVSALIPAFVASRKDPARAISE